MTHKQLSQTEFFRIEAHRKAGKTQNKIAQILEQHKSLVAKRYAVLISPETRRSLQGSLSLQQRAEKLTASCKSATTDADKSLIGARLLSAPYRLTYAPELVAGKAITS